MKATPEGVYMFEPLTQTVSQLAVRWGCSPRDVLTHAIQHNWPLYFQFDGLVFDVNDTANRSGGNSKQTEEIARLKADISRAEETLARNLLHARGQLKLTEWEGALTENEIRELRRAIDLENQMLEILSRAVERWNEQRQRYQRNGAVRATPDTLQDVTEQSSVSFPIRAYHPDWPVRLIRDLNGNGLFYEGRILALEDARHPKDKLTADDLFASMKDVKAIDAASLAIPGSAEPSTSDAAKEADIEVPQAGATQAMTTMNDSTSPSELRKQLDISRERGTRRRIIENWDDIEKEYGPRADSHQVLRVLKRDKGEREPTLKTVQNLLSDLKQKRLIP